MKKENILEWGRVAMSESLHSTYKKRKKNKSLRLPSEKERFQQS